MLRFGHATNILGSVVHCGTYDFIMINDFAVFAKRRAKSCQIMMRHKTVSIFKTHAPNAR